MILVEGKKLRARQKSINFDFWLRRSCPLNTLQNVIGFKAGAIGTVSLLAGQRCKSFGILSQGLLGNIDVGFTLADL